MLLKSIQYHILLTFEIYLLEVFGLSFASLTYANKLEYMFSGSPTPKLHSVFKLVHENTFCFRANLPSSAASSDLPVSLKQTTDKITPDSFFAILFRFVKEKNFAHLFSSTFFNEHENSAKQTVSK